MKSATKRFGSHTIELLIEEEMIVDNDGMVGIKWIDNELEFCQNKSNTARLNAQKGWSHRKAAVEGGKSGGDAVAKPLDSKVDAPNLTLPDKTLPNRTILEKVDSGVSGETHTKNKSVRKLIFEKTLSRFVTEFGKEMVRKFSDYWTESSPRGKKLRFEKEKVFDPERRLQLWLDRDKADKKSENGQTSRSKLRSNATVDTKKGFGKL